jgi:tetratricopeptide (TPR) repeat protein
MIAMIKPINRWGTPKGSRRRPVVQGCSLLLAAFLMLAPIATAQNQVPGHGGKMTPLQLLQTARTFFDQADYDNARKYYLQALPSFSKNTDVLRNLAFCYYSLGRAGYAQAARYYGRAYELDPANQDVADKLATCYLSLKRPAEAAAILKKAAEKPGAPAEIWKKVADAYTDAGNSAEAESAYDVYLQLRPGDLMARTQYAVLYGQQKDYAKAQAQLRLVLSSNPNYSPALIAMGRILSWQGQYEDSLSLYERVLRLNPSNGEALSGKAFDLLWMGHAEEAEALFAKLHRRYPKDDEVLRGMEAAQAAIEQKKLAQARQSGNLPRLEAIYRDRLAKNPKDLEALKALVALTADPARCAESIGFERRALELSPDDSSVQLMLARSLVRCQQYAEALAMYKQYLEAHPKSGGALFDVAQVLFREKRIPEATEAFRNLLKISPDNRGASLGLAQCLAASGNYQEALVRYDEALKSELDNYDALQGKAYVLYWTEHFAQARAIFEKLAGQRPSDLQNQQALDDIAKAEEAARWAALRPAPGSPPEEFVVFYQKRLASYPGDLSALKGLAYSEAQADNVPAAIGGYQRILDKNPDDLNAQKELARLLAQSGQYDKALPLYQSVVKNNPGDTASVEALGRVYFWSNRPADALPIYQQLLAKDPTNIGYKMQVARLELQLKDYPAARNALAAVVSADPNNREARLALAQLDFQQGHQDEALQQYDQVLKQDSKDATALLGKAQISYYQGNIPAAQEAATEAVNQHPQDFDALFLLANIEHARGHRHQTMEYLNQADQVHPGTPQVQELKQRVREEGAVTLHTSASYAREIGPPSAIGRTSANEDLRMYSYGTRLGFSILPKTDSYLSLSYMPTNSPPGPFLDAQGGRIPTGITGAAAPAFFLYRQMTRFSKKFLLRAGAGAVRFGPGGQVMLPGQPAPVTGGKVEAIGQAGFTVAPSTHFSFDVDVSRSPFAYTPTSAKFGVLQDSAHAGFNFFLTKRADLHFDYIYQHYTTADFGACYATDGVTPEGSSCHDQSHGGTALFHWNLVNMERFGLDIGYDGMLYGFAGQRRHVYMGFFNPSFYQRHLATGRIFGKLFGPVGYDISGGLGLQQNGQGNAMTRAWNVSPSFSLRVSDHLTLGARYTHYNTAQALGPLRGNAVTVTTDWRFY